MHSSILSLVASVGPALAAVQGFNYASTDSSGAAMTQAKFQQAFAAAKELQSAPGFTSARLYTMIDAGALGGVISAIPAAIASQTHLLLGLWASGTGFDTEIAALDAAIKQYGPELAPLVDGISIGSEDLYRISSLDLGEPNPGQQPSVLVDYIQRAKSTVAGTALSHIPVGHVDTWTAWVNGSNAAVVGACDFIGMDAYPYFEGTHANSIEVSKQLFQDAFSSTKQAAPGKPVWVTETGWPVSGPDVGQAVADKENAKTYWDQVGCELLFGETNVWWYTLQDSPQPATSPSFGVTGTEWTSTPLYDLSCSGNSTGGNAQSAASSATGIVSKSVAPVSSNTAIAQSAHGSQTLEAIPGPSYAAGVSAPGYSQTVGSTKSVVATVTSPVGYVNTVTTGSSIVVVGGVTHTVWQSTVVTVTSCSAGCPTTLTVHTGAASAMTTDAKPTHSDTPITGVASSVPSAASSSACPADLTGDYQFPHLIVPVSSEQPNKAYGTQYNGTLNDKVSTIFNFDIPQSYAGKSCSLVFLFPNKKDLETTDYTFNNKGGLVSHVLKIVATESTTYANKGAYLDQNGQVDDLTSGNEYVISHDTCPAGERVSFELMATGGLDLEWFNDYNPSPLGLFVRAC